MKPNPNQPLPVLLVDNEPSARQALRSHLQHFCPKLQLVGEAESLDEVRCLLQALTTCLLFLNVQLADGQGFDLLEKLERPARHVIFTTPNDRFALQVIRGREVDYLLKPIGPAAFKAAVGKVLERQALLTIEPPSALLQRPANYVAFEKIALPSSEGISLIKLCEIVRLEADGGYTNFFLVNGEHYLITRSIGEFEEILPKDTFFRIHLSHLVNLDFVKKICREEGGSLLMEDNGKVPIARRRKEAFFEVLRERVRF